MAVTQAEILRLTEILSGAIAGNPAAFLFDLMLNKTANQRTATLKAGLQSFKDSLNMQLSNADADNAARKTALSTAITGIDTLATNCGVGPLI